MEGQTNDRIRKQRLQRRLRNDMTDAERALWRILRNRQLAGCKFRRQHPYGDFILDFVCLERRIVIEVDGGQHAGSAADKLRDKRLEDAGFITLRFWNHDVLNDPNAVGDDILRRLLSRAIPHPLPGPPLEGEGGKTD